MNGHIKTTTTTNGTQDTQIINHMKMIIQDKQISVLTI